MEQKINNGPLRPYGSKSCEPYGSYFNCFYHYVFEFGKQPNYFQSKIKIKKSVLDKLESLGAKSLFVGTWEEPRDDKDTAESAETAYYNKDLLTVDVEIVYQYKDGLVVLYGSDFRQVLFDEQEEYEGETFVTRKVPKDNVYSFKILYQSEETLKEIRSLIEVAEEKKKKNNIFLLCKQDGSLIARRFSVKMPAYDIDIKLNYGDELFEKQDKILENLNQNKSGLILFSGKPGTGKSTFIKYISSKIERKIIYLPASFADEITDPSFLTFISEYKNSVFLLEDAEKVLRSRESQDNPAISNILNITDGFLGDCLNIFVLATFNTSRDQIDPALLRKGRLFVEHEFKEISVDSCNKIFEKIGSSRRTEVPLTIAEIYNEEDNFSIKEEIRRVGF
jgi:SpoVK/Ycf46/Vps4 family AAA+-type ATPase